MSKEEQELYDEKLVVQSSVFEGMSGTLGFGYGGNLGDKSGFALSAFLSQRYARYFGLSSYLAAASGTDAGAMGGFGLHFGHVFFIDPMLALVRPASYETSHCTDSYYGAGSVPCGTATVSPDPKLGMVMAMGVEIGLSRDWALTPMAAVGSTFDRFLDGTGTAAMFTIGLTARFGRADEYDQELKELRRNRQR